MPNKLEKEWDEKVLADKAMEKHGDTAVAKKLDKPNLGRR